jgi:WD40 repeat protein
VGLNRNIHIWDIRQPTPIRVIKEAHTSEVTCAAVNPRGSLIATGGVDAVVKLWDFSSGALLGSWAGHTGPVSKVSFSPDDNQLASVGKDGSMVLWRTS